MIIVVQNVELYIPPHHCLYVHRLLQKIRKKQTGSCVTSHVFDYTNL